MSTPNGSGPVGPDELQFDEAEYASPESTGRTACAVCQQPLTSSYFESGGRMVCPGCRGRIEDSLRGGSPLRRFLKAAVLGTLAALVGGVAYYVITEATGYNLSLVAIVLGLFVGAAVRKGSENRGGRLYQVLAVFLTYTAIVGMFVPMLARAFQEKFEKAPPAAARPADNAAKEAKAAEDPPPVPEARAAADPAQPAPRVTPLEFVGALAMLVAFAYAVPVLVGTQAPISFLIFGFALWEAWKVNRGLHVVFNGPFQLGDGDQAGKVVTDGA